MTITWQQTIEEMESEREEMIQYQVKELRRSREAAERSVDILMNAMKQTAIEFGDP